MNITNSYKWNNTRELNNKKLLEVFTNESISNKIKIWKLLNNSRRNVLRKLWDDCVFKRNLRLFLEDVCRILKPLEGYIQLDRDVTRSDIKNEYEFWIVRGIAMDVGIIPLTEDSAIDIENDMKKFNKAKQTVIDYLKEFKIREFGMFADFHDDELIKQLEDKKYKRPQTKKQWELKVRNEYLQIMSEIGIGKKRANSIINGIEKWYRYDKQQKDRFDLFRVEYKLDEKEEKLLYDLRVMDRVHYNGIEDIHSNAKHEVLKVVNRLKKQNINEENYKKILYELEEKRIKLIDKTYLYNRQADDFFENIRKIVIKNLYP